MSNLQLIEALCGTVEALASIVKRLAGKLAQLHALDEEERKAISAALEGYTKAIGANEAPDGCFEEWD